jgi:hypothetical protein
MATDDIHQILVKLALIEQRTTHIDTNVKQIAGQHAAIDDRVSELERRWAVSEGHQAALYDAGLSTTRMPIVGHRPRAVIATVSTAAAGGGAGLVLLLQHLISLFNP